jgi:hypothetical protein
LETVSGAETVPWASTTPFARSFAQLWQDLRQGSSESHFGLWTDVSCCTPSAIAFEQVGRWLPLAQHSTSTVKFVRRKHLGQRGAFENIAKPADLRGGREATLIEQFFRDWDRVPTWLGDVTCSPCCRRFSASTRRRRLCRRLLSSQHKSNFGPLTGVLNCPSAEFENIVEE